MFFFFQNLFFLFLFFFFLEKFDTHWLTQIKKLFFFSGTGKNKKQHFYWLTRFFPKIAQSLTIPGKYKNTVPLLEVILEIILTLTNLTNRYSVPSGSNADLNRGAKPRVFGWIDGWMGWIGYQKSSNNSKFAEGSWLFFFWSRSSLMVLKLSFKFYTYLYGS